MRGTIRYKIDREELSGEVLAEIDYIVTPPDYAANYSGEVLIDGVRAVSADFWNGDTCTTVKFDAEQSKHIGGLIDGLLQGDSDLRERVEEACWRDTGMLV